MSTLIIHHDDCLQHDPGPGHPEQVARLDAVLGALEGLDPALRRRVQRMLKGTLGRASAAGAAAADVATEAPPEVVLDAAPAMGATTGVKDRRKADIRALDEQAQVCMPHYNVITM